VCCTKLLSRAQPIAINIIFVKVFAWPIGSKKQAIMQGFKFFWGHFSSIQGAIDGMHFSISKHVRPF
jgi:hypothetical protein